MRYLVYGTGAVGGYIGGRLALSGLPTTFLARPRIAAALQDSGLQIIGGTRHEHLPEPRVIVNPQEALTEPCPDVILLTVKTFDVQTAGEQILKFAPKPIPIICFTNGVGSETFLSNLLTHHPIISATTTTAVQMRENRIIQIERERGIGLAGSQPVLASIAKDIDRTGIFLRRYKNPERMKWSKLLTNIVSNATSAIVGWPPKRIFSHPDLYRLEVEALREAVRVMRKKGIKTQNLPKVPVTLLSFGIFFPPWITQSILGRIVTKGRGSKLPSFHYDIGTGHSEIMWLNGAVVKGGERVGLPTPANRILTQTVLKLSEDSSEHDHFRDHPIELLKRASEAGVPGIQGYNP